MEIRLGPGRGRGPLVVVVVVVVAALVALAAPPAVADGKSEIVFTRDAGGDNGRILLTNGTGTRTQRLTSPRTSNILPRWGPGGHRILYTRAALTGRGGTDLMVMGARGRHKRVLLPGEGRNLIQDVAWGPGARRVVMVMDREGPQGFVRDLWMYTLASGRLRRLHVEHSPDRLVAAVDWSRDGTIVFSAFERVSEQEDQDVYFVQPDGSGLRRVTNTPDRREESPRFSPDGRRLVYAAASGVCRFLVVAASDGSGAHRAGRGCNLWEASWSPSSRRLLVMMLHDKGESIREEIWSRSVDGSSRRFVVAGSYASWRPR